MTRIKRLVRPETQAFNWKAAVPAIALAAASLVGCAQTGGVGQAPGESASAGLNQRALLDFNSCPKPVYPAEALARKARGTVDLAFLVGVDGSVRDSAVRSSSGDASLDETARVALTKCSFSPAIANGKAVEKWESVKYVWNRS
jgi:bla regulator protein BlaR1